MAGKTNNAAKTNAQNTNASKSVPKECRKTIAAITIAQATIQNLVDLDLMLIKSNRECASYELCHRSAV